jgi:transposase
LEEKQGIYLTSFQRQLLLKNLQGELRPEYRRRIEIMLLADLGQSQAHICTALGCAQETARYWITVAQVGQAHNWSNRAKGRPKTVNEQYLNRLKELVSHSPRDYGYSFQRWTAQWLSKHMAKELGIKVSYINMLLKEMGLSTCQKPALETNQDRDSNIEISDLQSDFSPEPLWIHNLI